MEYFGKSRNGDYRRHRPSQEYSPDNRERSELQSSRKTTPSSNFENLNGNGDRNFQRTRSIDGTANGSGPRHLPLGGSNVFYGYGGPFRLDDDTDGSSEMDSSLDFKIQPWMDKITGGTFKRNYIDRYSFRPSLHHDSQNRIGDIPQFRRSNESSIESYTKGSKSRTIKTILLIFLGIILIGIVAGVIAYFLSKKENGDATIKYYVASGEISLNEIFDEELSNSSSQEFKKLSLEFCGAISEALQNSTDNGDKYRLCEVIDFRNGSIKVRFKVYYVYTATIIITNETVQKDLNNSLIPQNAGLAQLSTLVIIRVSLKITVEVEIFQKENDPVATSLLSSTTPSITIETTTVPAATTTTSVTTSTPTTLPTNATTQITLNDTSTPPTSTTPMNTTTADYSTTSDTATAETTEEFDATTEEAQLNITTTTITAESTADTKATPTTTTENTIPETTESSTEESTIAVTTKSGSTTESRISETTESSTKSTIAVTTKSESSTESTIPVTTQTESTIPVTTQKESTIPVTTQTESTILVTTQTTWSSTKNNKPTTTAVKDIITYMSSTEKTTSSTTMATERTTDTKSSVELTTTTETKNTAASATPMTSLASSTDISTTQTIITTTNTISMVPSTKSASTESTSKIIDTTSTEIPSKSTTGTETITSIAPSTNNTNQTPSIPTDSTSVVSKVNEITSESTTVTESTTKNVSKSTTNVPADSTTDNTTPIMITTSLIQGSTQCNDCITDSTVDTTSDSTAKFTIQSTFETTTAVTVEHTAGIRASRITAIVGESATTQACVISPDGEWLHVDLSIDFNSSSHVIAKLDHNKTFEKPTSVDRFNGSINMNGNDIVVRLTVDLTSPKPDLCTWDSRYFMKCSVTMNDTMQTRKSNGSDISITAPMAKVNINPGVDYTEGDLVTFNCSTKIDPNYREVSLEINSFVMDNIIISPIPSERNSDCSVNATWSARSPNPLTTNENGVVIRCIVKNSLLNKSETIEKTLNVSAVDVAFSKYSYTTLTKEVQVIECIARGSSAILQNMTIIRDSVDIVTLDGSGTPMILTSENRYTVTKENDADNVKLILTIKTVDCEDQGTYRCNVLTTKNDPRSSPGMTFNVIGATPTLTLNPDIYERFARRGRNHICTTEHTGDKESDKYLEIQVNGPDGTSGFRYSKKLPLPESEKEFNSENNITYINITGTIARFLLVSDFTTNNSCNNTQTIVFLLDRPMEFDNGIVKCVLRDDNFEYASATENITVIPDEYCFGYEDIPKRNHPNNDCSDFVNCFEDAGRMYARGESCTTPSECMDFSLGDCVLCHENVTCKSPEPVTTTTTLAPGKTYVQCSDVSQKEGLPIKINCTVLDDTFQSLNVTFTSSSNGNKEENVGVILPDGTIKNQARSSPVLNTTFSMSSKYIHFVIDSSSCMEEGKYFLADTNVSLDTQPSISAFFFDNLVPVKELTINSESLYKEGKPLIFNCTATVDSDHTELLGYFKLPSDISYVKVQGEQTILQTFAQNCTKSVVSRFDTGLLVSANLNGTKLKCLYNEISPEASEEKNVKIQSADVAFNTYKLKAEVQSKANFTCLIRSTGSYKAIKILKIINSTSMIEMASYTQSSDSVQSVAGVDANFSSNALTLIFASVKCPDEGQYNCTVIMDDDSEEQPPLSLDIQVTTSPGSSTVELLVDPDIVEGRFSLFHHCLGSVGYPEVGGYLEITFVHPLTNENITLNKESLRTISRDEMEIQSTLMPYIKEDCKTMEKISFRIKPSRKWNRGKIVCEVKSHNESVQKATKEEVLYVIDASFCNSTNNQEIFFDHEKKDFCNTYVHCSRGEPYGRLCPPNLCVFVGEDKCDDCSGANCPEEVTTTEPTTDLVTETTTTQLGSHSLNCTSPSVYEGESATIPCSLNVSSFDFISVSNDKGMIMSLFENATVVYFGDSSSTFQGSLTGKTVIFIVKNLNCNNSLDYIFKLYNGGEVSSSVTANPLMKVKPITPVLDIDYRLEMGKNQKFHTCEGYVGNPKGSLELEIRNGSLATYTKYIPTIQSVDTPVYENCNYHLTLRFSIDLTKDNLTGQYLRCLANNIKSLESTDPIPMSNEVLIIPLPANPCSEGDGIFAHPRDCYHYLQCANDIAYARSCAAGTCFNDTAKACL